MPWGGVGGERNSCCSEKTLQKGRRKKPNIGKNSKLRLALKMLRQNCHKRTRRIESKNAGCSVETPFPKKFLFSFHLQYPREKKRVPLFLPQFLLMFFFLFVSAQTTRFPQFSLPFFPNCFLQFAKEEGNPEFAVRGDIFGSAFR